MMGYLSRYCISGNENGQSTSVHDQKDGWKMSIEQKATAAQENLESKFSKLGTGKYGRIIKMCRTPSTEEYKRSLLIVAAGLAVLGVVGFGIYWLMSYLPGYF